MKNYEGWRGERVVNWKFVFHFKYGCQFLLVRLLVMVMINPPRSVHLTHSSPSHPSWLKENGNLVYLFCGWFILIWIFIFLLVFFVVISFYLIPFFNFSIFPDDFYHLILFFLCVFPFFGNFKSFFIKMRLESLLNNYE